MIRIVLDTNVLVSALLKAQGTEAAVLSAVAEKRVSWCVSPAVLAEYGEVLRRPKFSRIPRQFIEALLALAARAEQVRPAMIATASPHEPDNRFLECAKAAGAAYLITGNQRHFPARHKATKVVTARLFLDAMDVQAGR